MYKRLFAIWIKVLVFKWVHYKPESRRKATEKGRERESDRERERDRESGIMQKERKEEIDKFIDRI